LIVRVMDCQQIEILLPAYIESDLTAGEMASVRAHLDGCRMCQDAVASFQALEVALVTRGEQVPTLDSVLPALIAQASTRRSRALRFFDAAFSLPGIICMALGFLGMLTFFYRDVIAGYLARQFAQPLTWEDVAVRFGALTANTAHVDVLVLTAVYSLVTLLIVASTGYITLRFVRQR